VIEMLNDLYLPDYKRLSTMLIGAPGGGKSFFVSNTLMEFVRRSEDENLRVIYCCPKQEMFLGEGTFTTLDKLEKHLSKNRIAVVYPDPMNLEAEVDYMIDFMFDLRDANQDLKIVYVQDDSQIFLSSRKAATPSWKRLALTGRSRGIRLVSISHTPVFSKELEGSTSYIVHFRTLLSPMHINDFKNRFGYDPEPYVESLNEVPYSHVFFDVTTGKSKMMAPLELKGEA
tara:strand:+ start:1880 stop:2566 length:687 start_codon:yes stop_codon:yes gene_type:complete